MLTRQNGRVKGLGTRICRARRAPEVDGGFFPNSNSRDIYEQAVVKPVLSLSKERSRDFFAGIPRIYSASPGTGRQASAYGTGSSHHNGVAWP
jgi:hypothetical protein